MIRRICDALSNGRCRIRVAAEELGTAGTPTLDITLDVPPPGRLLASDVTSAAGPRADAAAAAAAGGCLPALAALASPRATPASGPPDPKLEPAVRTAASSGSSSLALLSCHDKNKK